jgi:hypothetical protein
MIGGTLWAAKLGYGRHTNHKIEAHDHCCIRMGMKKIDLALLLLYADRQRPIDGNTRFEKLLFLAQEEISKKKGGSRETAFDFEPDRFGPLSVELYDQLHYLAMSGMISSQEQKNYSLTTRGKQFVERVVLPRNAEMAGAIERLKEKFGTMDLTALLKYVYTNYPEFAVKSEIRDRIMMTNAH